MGEPVVIDHVEPTSLDEAVAMFDALERENTETPIVEESNAQLMLNEHRQASVTKLIDPELQKVVNELGKMAFVNIADLYETAEMFEEVGVDENGDPRYQLRTRMSLKDFTKLPREISACIKKIEIKHNAYGSDVKLELYDKLASLDKLMRFHGGYAKENEQKAAASDKLLDMLFQGAEAEGLPVPKSNEA